MEAKVAQNHNKISTALIVSLVTAIFVGGGFYATVRADISDLKTSRDNMEQSIMQVNSRLTSLEVLSAKNSEDISYIKQEISSIEQKQDEELKILYNLKK